MNDDLVKRLRERAENVREGDHVEPYEIEEAADRIEELEAENARLKDKIESLYEDLAGESI